MLRGSPHPACAFGASPASPRGRGSCAFGASPGSPRGGAAPHSLHWRLMLNLVSARGLPVYSTFFLWSFGTGANQLARPLFAASFGVPLALVALVTSSNSLAHLLTGPLTGYAMDRWGRRPMLVLGLVLRGVSLFFEFYANSYVEYLILEFIGGVGVAMF